MNLKNIRRNKGYTQDKLAKMLNISRTTISCWESGISQPDHATLIKLSKIFEVTVDEILGVAPMRYEELSAIEQEFIQTIRLMPMNRVKEALIYIKYLAGK